MPIIRVVSIPVHSNGEADHVAGLPNRTIRSAIATGDCFQNATCMIDFLEQKYSDKTNPTYVLKEIDNKELLLLRNEAKLKVFKIGEGSNTFQLMVFHLFSNIIKAYPRLCICNKCQVEYGSCELFSQYLLEEEQLKKMNLRSVQTVEFLEEGVVN